MNKKKDMIEKLLVRIGLKTKPLAILTVGENKPSGVRLKGKRLTVKPKIKAEVTLPNPKTIKDVDQESIDIMKLVDSNPVKAMQMAVLRDKRVSNERKEKARFLALSPLEIEREAERKVLIEKAALSLTANLPKVREIQLDINWNEDVLLQHIAEAAFRSSLESDVLWIGGGNFGGNLYVKIGAVTEEIKTNDMELLDTAAAKLFSWSGVVNVLEDPTSSELKRFLSNAADSYTASQRKLKSSEYYLGLLVEKAIEAPLKYIKESAKRLEILEALALATAEAGIAIGFFKDSKKNVHIDCSDNRFGTTQLTSKIMLPYMQSIIDGSSVAGRLTSGTDSAKLLEAFTNLLKK
ncbi:hypothetical protein [Maribacter stanieri]|uniref:Uncharacterized protein n=1 Tax=Maribacter stanieri TaxID=440514 RepID=A0A1I6IEN2_9FLAO|nr:hypothetical protein [Maribacter stanieri]SFR65143.1 hypothetical protein SAMN04488010_1576 [Maribacter stanieri]